MYAQGFKKLGHGGREARESDVNDTIVVQTQNVSTKLTVKVKQEAQLPSAVAVAP